MNLAALLTALDQDGKVNAPKPTTSAILPEAKIVELRATVERYNAPCPFKVGELVTPRANAPVNGAGDVHIVAEVFDEPVYSAAQGTGNWTEYSKYDMRVFVLASNGEPVPHMTQSWCYEPYTGEGADLPA